MEEVPNHIAITPDGNRRWARQKGLSLEEGYRRGIDKFFEIAKFLRREGVKEVTVWSFSTENFSRPEEEKAVLFNLFTHYLQRGIKEMDKEKEVKVRFIGRLPLFPKEMQEMMAKVMEETKDRGPYVVNFLMGYGGKAELEDAMERACREGIPLEEALPTAPMQDVDIVVRAGGEVRLSGFLPVKAAYAELFFLKKLWPDVTEEDFSAILEEFQHRERRFGR